MSINIFLEIFFKILRQIYCRDNLQNGLRARKLVKSFVNVFNLQSNNNFKFARESRDFAYFMFDHHIFSLEIVSWFSRISRISEPKIENRTFRRVRKNEKITRKIKTILKISVSTPEFVGHFSVFCL